MRSLAFLAPVAAVTADDWLGGMPIVVNLHFPKCGGTTLCRAAKENGLSMLVDCQFAADRALYDNHLGMLPLDREPDRAPPNGTARVALAPRRERLISWR